MNAKKVLNCNEWKHVRIDANSSWNHKTKLHQIFFGRKFSKAGIVSKESCSHVHGTHPRVCAQEPSTLLCACKLFFPSSRHIARFIQAEVRSMIIGVQNWLELNIQYNDKNRNFHWTVGRTYLVERHKKWFLL